MSLQQSHYVLDQFEQIQFSILGFRQSLFSILPQQFAQPYLSRLRRIVLDYLVRGRT